VAVELVDGGHQRCATVLLLQGQWQQQVVLEGLISLQLLHQYACFVQGLVGAEQHCHQG
jgi:hypothetical protein